MKLISLGVLTLALLGSAGCNGNPCTRSTDRVVARFEKCNVHIDTDATDDNENVTDLQCTDELADEKRHVADCTEAASCTALTGGAGADGYARCLLASP